MKKPPKRNPKDERPQTQAAPKGEEKFYYTNEQKSRLWNRLFKIIGVETRIEIVLSRMEELKLAPDVKQLSRTLRRLKIYPPPADHADHVGCRCEWCAPKASGRARRSFPAYYINKDGRSFEHHLERREVDASDDGLEEELVKLRGESPGVVVDMRERIKSGRSGRAA